MEFESCDKTPEDLMRRDRPYSPYGASLCSYQLLRTALDQSPGNWEQVSFSENIECFTAARMFAASPYASKVDLIEKLGSAVVVGSEE